MAHCTEARNLLDRILNTDPAQRISIEEILHDDWVLKPCLDDSQLVQSMNQQHEVIVLANEVQKAEDILVKEIGVKRKSEDDVLIEEEKKAHDLNWQMQMCSSVNRRYETPLPQATYLHLLS